MFKFSKIPYIKLVPIIIITLLLYKLINNIEYIPALLRKSVDLLSYFIWGFAIAYFLNPMIMYLEKKFKVRRIISIPIVYLFFIAFITVIMVLIVPEMVKNASDIISKLSTILTDLTNYITTSINDNKFFINNGVSEYFNNNLNTILIKANSIIEASFTFAFTNMLGFSTAIFSFTISLLTGIIISIYLLFDKEKILNYMNRFFSTVLSSSLHTSLVKIINETNLVFKQYVIGKIIVATTVSVLCFIGLQIAQVKYALLISIILGVTNLIPYVGYFIGLIPALIITIFTGFAAVIKLLILILLISVAEGWFIGPKIVGDKVGLSPVLILLAIFIGGGLYGIVGMFLSIPLAAVLKIFLDEYLLKKENEKSELSNQ